MSFTIDHTPFIVGSYVVFALLMLADFFGALRARRRPLEQLRARAQRQARRAGRSGFDGTLPTQPADGAATQ